MGLLSHIKSIKADTEPAENEGGLYRAEPVSVQKPQYKPFDFHNFADEIGLQKTAILVPFASRFLMRYSHGFDAETVFGSVSTADFWNGTFPGIQDWHHFTGTQLEPYYQLFSRNEMQTAKELYIKSFPLPSDIAARAIMVIADDISDSTETLDAVMEELADCISSDMLYTPYNIRSAKPEPDTEQSTDSACRVFTLFFEDAIKAAASEAAADPESAAMLEATVFSEIFIQLRARIAEPNCCVQDSAHTMKLKFVSEDTVDGDLVLFQCKKTLFPVLGKASQQIRIAYDND